MCSVPVSVAISARKVSVSRLIDGKPSTQGAVVWLETDGLVQPEFSINGGALTETVFTWPGIGRELVFSVSHADYPLAQAAFLLIAIVVLVANLVVDVLYAYLDPRIRY